MTTIETSNKKEETMKKIDCEMKGVQLVNLCSDVTTIPRALLFNTFPVMTDMVMAFKKNK